jgi:DedD protein
MPDPVAPQLDELRRRARRRLVGAVVLALAAAVLVPMLLESEQKPLGEDVSVKIPPIDDGKFVSKLAEHAKPDASKSATGDAAPGTAPPATSTSEAAKQASSVSGTSSGKTVAQAEQRVLTPSSKTSLKESPAPAVGTNRSDAGSAPAAAAASASGATAASVPPSEAKASPPAPAKTAPAETTKSQAGDAASQNSSTEPFSVQLAAFADDKGANALAGKLKKAGHPAYTEPYSTSRGTLWRVRVGPYSTRDAAEAARTKLKAEGQNGIIATGR